MDFAMPDVISKKRDGKEITNEEYHWFIQQVIRNDVEECQIGAMLMAMYLKGISETETFNLTNVLANSGEVIQWNPNWFNILVDKHSIGGVGDKISLPLAPALAAVGMKVPMCSGRGLGHTGGTLDKLESIPGYNVIMSKEQQYRALEEIGCFICGQSADLAPGDRELYKRRDVTATVDSIPLIVASIISKKYAEGTKFLVLDIKCGNGSFLKNFEDAQKLSNYLISVATKLGITTKAAITNMDTPIGQCVGNALEIIETIDTLKGKGPKDVVELVSTLGGLLLLMANKVKSLHEGKESISEVLKNGKALNCWEKMLIFNGVSKENAQELCFGDVKKILPLVPKVTKLPAKTSGYIHKIEAMPIATVCKNLGAGRNKASESIDHRVGIKLLKVEGDKIYKGDPWIEVHHSSLELDTNLRLQLENAILISSKELTLIKPTILEII